jgi:metal-sulfur cluster biosynthetic enzyme
MLNKQIRTRYGKSLKYVKDVSLVFNLYDLPMSKRVEQVEQSNARLQVEITYQNLWAKLIKQEI